MAVAGINYWLADRPKEQQGGIDSTVVPGEPKLEVTEVEYPVEQKPAEVVEKNDSQPNSFSGRLQDIVKQRAADGDKVAKPVEVVVQSEREPQAPAQTTTVIEQETKQKTSEAQNSVEQRPAEAGKKSDSQTNPFRGRLQDIVKQRAADGDKVAKPVEVVAQSEPEPQASAQTTTVTEQETKPGNQEAIKEVKPVEVVPQREPSPIPAPKGPGYLAWEFKTQGDVSSSPAIGIDGIVYCTSEDRKVYALDGKTGKKIWEFEASSLMKSSPAIGSDGTVYVGSLFGYLHALDGKTGAKKWAKRISTYSSCAIGVDDLLYIGSEDGHLHVFDCKTGVIKWKYRTGDWIRSSPVIGGSGEVYFVSYNNKVYSLDKSKPFKIWEHDLPIMGKVGGSFAVAYDGTLYFGATSKRIYALSGKTGELEWEFETEDWVSSSPAIGTDGTVYVGSNDGRMYALDGTTGVRKWMYQTEGSVVSSPALGDNEVVYFGSIDDYFYALDSKTGAVKWVFRTDGDVSSSPVLSEDGMIYFGSDDNWIYALKTSSKGPANSSWPMYRQNPQHTGRLPSIKQIEQTNTTTSTEHNTKTHKSQLKTQAKYKYLKPSLPNSGDRQLATSYIADGDSAKKSREWQLAKALYLKAVEADPACFDAHWELASVALTIGETELALKSYEYAMALSPNDLPAQNNFALSLVQGNYFSDAERTLKTILELEPNHVAAHFELGRLYSEKLNDAGKAAAHYKRVIELQPKHRQEKTIRDWLVRNKTNLAVNPPPKEPKKSAAKSVPVRLDEQLNQE
jgi:outer membrane protein assembly factor BamB/Flp pilus assembly protein TadD